MLWTKKEAGALSDAGAAGEIPPVDRTAPFHTETATFALG